MLHFPHNCRRVWANSNDVQEPIVVSLYETREAEGPWVRCAASTSPEMLTQGLPDSLYIFPLETRSLGGFTLGLTFQITPRLPETAIPRVRALLL